MPFVHLHVHTQYSILDGQSSIENLFNRAEQMGMPGLAITDHGNLYGIKEFCKFAKKHPSVKPIIGCEIYVSRHYDHKLKDNAHRSYYHLILLAKNYAGYKNLMKIVSTGHIEGMYYGKPRVSHEVIEKYHEGLICSSACMAGEIPRAILDGDMAAADRAVEWHKKVFGEDFYLEVMLHKTEVPGLSLDVWEGQMQYVPVIFELAQKHGVKVIATNDVHFVDKEDGPAHDLLICLNTGKYVDETDRLHYTQQEYLKSEEEMRALFPDHPEAIDNTLEILDKIEKYSIDRDHVLPKFELPQEFTDNLPYWLDKYADVIDAGRNDENGNYRGDEFCASVAYMCKICYDGAKVRYGDSLSNEQAERLDFELKTISRMGFPDYFLIVQDFINWAKNNGISVGPGRGSAAGSAAAYCFGITNLDPIRYDLLFERFLNPDRISMPDIDVDFDDEGRYRVIQYVQEKYGEDHISHVITFGTMAAKLAIKDVARVCRLPLEESNRLTKIIPDRPFTVKVDGEEKEFKPNLKNCVKYLSEMRQEFENGSPEVRSVLSFALKLEGCIRQTGIHACAMIIGRGDLTDYIPITMGADKATGQDVWVSQLEGSYIEDVGMLKMDFLGLKTLSIIKECLSLVKKRHGVDIDIEKIPIDDPQTYALYSRGDTKSVFQFESPGMKEWLQKLHPERFEDLIAMNALYRPGPMDYIPSFVARKRGEEEITFDLPAMGEYLEETYGVTVYQEQVMRISQKVAGFSRGKADKLRKAMGKKQITVLEGLHDDFIKGAVERGHPLKTLEKIWSDWRKFASYAFNKSHATCYAWVSYQTGWLKAHYPAEFQAANLSNQLSNMTEIQEIMDDCRRSKIPVLNPDVNESDNHFTVNKEGAIRFGLGGMKGFGANIVEAIVTEREERGLFKDIYDFIERMAGIVGRKPFESLVNSGAMDSFGYPRRQYFTVGRSGKEWIDELIEFGVNTKSCQEDNLMSLFGDSEELKPIRPEPPIVVGEEDLMEVLQKEKELVGMYLSSHPLDKYRFELETFTSFPIGQLNDHIKECEAKQTTERVRVAGLVTNFKEGSTRTGKPMARALIEDFNGSYELALFGKDCEKYMSYLRQEHATLFIEGEIGPQYRLRPEDIAAGKRPKITFNPREMQLLGNVTEQKLKALKILVSTPMLNEEFRRRLVAIVRANKGPIELKMYVHDPGTGFKIEFTSRKFHVALSSDFLADLKALGIAYTAVLK